jgi:hypothetical protein
MALGGNTLTPAQLNGYMAFAGQGAGAPALASGISGSTLAAFNAMLTPAPEGDESGAARAADAVAANANAVDLPVDMDELADQILTRIKRQLALDHDRAGGYLSDLLR